MSEPNEDEGFLALLKPIQDITRNWEVDLSQHLEEYITHIRQICGDNVPDMNFVQAAVLVQNSATIYCKKVDFLFGTVLDLLDDLTKNVAEAKNKEGGAHGPGRGRRKANIALDTEQFAPLDSVCADRCLSLDLVKETQKAKEIKKQKIVLNAAIKVKAKAMTSCTIYNHKHEILGKKEEFRLNWRICSAGTLHQEFIISKNRFRSMEPVEVTVSAPEDCNHEYSGVANDHEDWRGDEGDEAVDAPPTTPPCLTTSIVSTAPIIDSRENRQAQMRPPANLVDVIEMEWQPNDFNDNICPEKIIKKRKIVKTPVRLMDEKKRKHENGFETLPIIEVLFMSYKNATFGRDLDFCFESKNSHNERRRMVLMHNTKYLDHLEKEVSKEQNGDFKGFHIGEVDSDNDLDFEGFDEVNSDGDEIPNVDIPLPEKDNDIIQDHLSDRGWRGDDPSSYDNEAMKTMQAFRSRKIDHDKMTDMARRVEEWHQKILPKLESAEERSGFDVHEYGTEILNSFDGEIGTVKLFEDVVVGKPREEVARYFLSTLMLANQYNVEISETEKGDLNTDCVQLKLLSTTRHHEELDDNLRHTSEK